MMDPHVFTDLFIPAILTSIGGFIALLVSIIRGAVTGALHRVDKEILENRHRIEKLEKEAISRGTLDQEVLRLETQIGNGFSSLNKRIDELVRLVLDNGRSRKDD